VLCGKVFFFLTYCWLVKYARVTHPTPRGRTTSQEVQWGGDTLVSCGKVCERLPGFEAGRLIASISSRQVHSVWEEVPSRSIALRGIHSRFVRWPDLVVGPINPLSSYNSHSVARKFRRWGESQCCSLRRVRHGMFLILADNTISPNLFEAAWASTVPPPRAQEPPDSHPPPWLIQRQPFVSRHERPVGRVTTPAWFEFFTRLHCPLRVVFLRKT